MRRKRLARRLRPASHAPTPPFKIVDGGQGPSLPRAALRSRPQLCPWSARPVATRTKYGRRARSPPRGSLAEARPLGFSAIARRQVTTAAALRRASRPAPPRGPPALRVREGPRWEAAGARAQLAGPPRIGRRGAGVASPHRTRGAACPCARPRPSNAPAEQTAPWRFRLLSDRPAAGRRAEAAPPPGRSRCLLVPAYFGPPPLDSLRPRRGRFRPSSWPRFALPRAP